MINELANDLVTRDLKYNWHPCAQMKDYEVFSPLIIKAAKGSFIELADGRKIIDGISSWWCKSLGHNHPELKKALLKQIDLFEHVIFAHTTNEIIVKLSEKLATLTHSLNKIFYASEGSSAVEIALKMSLHTRILHGETKRRKFMSLQNSYHGETLGALSVSDLGIYKKPYESILFDTLFIKNIPYVQNSNDPFWHDCSQHWKEIEKQLEHHKHELTAIIIEPILQAAAGMLVYSKDFLHKLRQWTRNNGVHLIADEIMTGFYRTGLPLSCQHADIEPDFLCLGKGLTSGWLPLSVTLTNKTIFNLFYDDYATGKSFLHSHTHSGNALSAAVALACFEVMESQNMPAAVKELENQMSVLFNDIAHRTGKLTNIRGLGGVIAGDLIVDNPSTRAGFSICQKATELGALLRPLGNTIYWCPPLNIEFEVLEELKKITELALVA